MAKHAMEQCDHWTGSVRCGVPGAFWLMCPDGEPCPGGAVCEQHGTEIVAEYADKLGETWRLRPVAPSAEGQVGR